MTACLATKKLRVDHFWLLHPHQQPSPSHHCPSLAVDVGSMLGLAAHAIALAGHCPWCNACRGVARRLGNCGRGGGRTIHDTTTTARSGVVDSPPPIDNDEVLDSPSISLKLVLGCLHRAHILLWEVQLDICVTEDGPKNVNQSASKMLTLKSTLPNVGF